MGTRLTGAVELFDPGLTLSLCSAQTCGDRHRWPWPCGREWTVPLVDAELGLWCRTYASVAAQLHAASTPAEVRAAQQRVAALPAPPGTPEQREMSLSQRILGTAYDAMVADRVPDAYVEFCGMTAYVWVALGDDAAQQFWAAGGRPEAAGPANRAERRAAQRIGGSRTAAVDETKPQASTSGTSTRTTSSGSGRGRRRRSRGR